MIGEVGKKPSWYNSNQGQRHNIKVSIYKPEEHLLVTSIVRLSIDISFQIQSLIQLILLTYCWIETKHLCWIAIKFIFWSSSLMGSVNLLRIWTINMNGFKECLECHKAFKNKYSLKRHTSVVHGGNRPHTCQCGKAFATIEQLTRHSNSKHTFEKPYECLLGCGKAFSSYTARDYHHKAIHGNWKYVCFCGKAYSSKYNLKYHICKTHIYYWMCWQAFLPR